jgi:iron(III) transport system substrate-binding protein
MPTRRVLIKGLAAGALAAAGGRPLWAAAADSVDLDKARAEGSLTLYTSLDTKIVDAVVAAFKQKYGIDVKYLAAGAHEIASKVLAEADAKRIQADMVDASDLASLLLMKDKGLLETAKTDATGVVPADLRDAGGTWIADRLTQVVIQYNTKEFGQSPPKSWKDLADPRFKGRLVYSCGPNGDAAPRLYTLARHLGWDVLKGVAGNDPLRVQSNQLLTQVLESGERGVGVATNDNLAWRSKQQGKPTDYLFPAEGVPTEPGACALLKSASKPNAAALFFSYWMSKDAQTLLSAQGKYSSRSDVDAPAGSPPLGSLKLLTLDYAAYQKDMPDILQQMKSIFGGEWGI